MLSQPVFLFKDIGNNKTTTSVKIIAFPPSPFSLPVCVEELVKTGRNDCLTTSQHKNKSAIGCLINDIYINVNKTGRKEMFYLTTHSRHFKFGYMASNIW